MAITTGERVPPAPVFGDVMETTTETGVVATEAPALGDGAGCETTAEMVAGVREPPAEREGVGTLATAAMTAGVVIAPAPAEGASGVAVMSMVLGVRVPPADKADAFTASVIEMVAGVAVASTAPLLVPRISKAMAVPLTSVGPTSVHSNAVDVDPGGRTWNWAADPSRWSMSYSSV